MCLCHTFKDFSGETKSPKKYKHERTKRNWRFGSLEDDSSIAICLFNVLLPGMSPYFAASTQNDGNID